MRAPDRRIVYANDMHRDAARISVSLATVEFKLEAGTRLVFAEQAAFLDGHEGGCCEQGTRSGFERLDAELRRHSVAA